MDEKTLRALIEAGSVRALHIIADGPLFHVEVLTTRQGALTALTGKGAVKTWTTLDVTARWVRALGMARRSWMRPAGCRSRRRYVWAE